MILGRKTAILGIFSSNTSSEKTLRQILATVFINNSVELKNTVIEQIRFYINDLNTYQFTCTLPKNLIWILLQPDERVWNHAKADVGKRPIQSKTEMERVILAAMHPIKEKAELVKSFFRLPETKYAGG